MYFLYIDESGTSESPGTTSHYVLAGLSVPIWKWKTCEKAINKIKAKYSLVESEIHTGWLIRRYPEQDSISGFCTLDYPQRRSQVEAFRRGELLRQQRSPTLAKRLKQLKKNYRQTEAYIHLTYDERKSFVFEVAQCIGKWGFARLFAECIDKVFFDPAKSKSSIDEQAFEQIVSRFEKYLKGKNGLLDSEIIGNGKVKTYGLLIHDNNETVEKKHTGLMKQFHKTGTLWTSIDKIIETPLFVDSSLTSMIQMADICAYSIRRYLENNEEKLFDEVFARADRRGKTTVGIRHFTKRGCPCKICASHRGGTNNI